MASNADNYYAKKIFLLGTADFGPVNIPIKVSSANYVKTVFGEQGSLLDAFRVIKESDADCEVFMVKVSGKHSELYLNINLPNSEIEENGFYFKSKYANEIYNDVQIIIREDALYINYPTDALGKYYLQYKYNETDENGDDVLDDEGNIIYKTLYDLAEEINEDTRMMNSEVYCYLSCDPKTMANTSLVGVNEHINTLRGGNSGIYYNKNMIYNCLSDTYNILEGMNIDIIIPVECYYDDTFTDDKDGLLEYFDLEREYITLKDEETNEYLSYYNQLLEFLRRQLRFGCITHGIMGMNPNGEVFLDQDKYYLKLQYLKKLNNKNSFYDKYRQLISICVGDIYTTYGTRVYNSYILYATLIAGLQVIENTTNKPLPDSFTAYNDFDNMSLSKIRELGFTAFRYSALKKSVVVSSGVTASNDINFKYLCNIRMCQLVMVKVNELLSNYIGEDISYLIKTKQIQSKLLDVLNNLISKNVLLGFSINSMTIPEKGHLLLDLSFKTVYMTESIRAYAGLAAYTRGSVQNE